MPRGLLFLFVVVLLGLATLASSAPASPGKPRTRKPKSSPKPASPKPKRPKPKRNPKPSPKPISPKRSPKPSPLPSPSPSDTPSFTPTVIFNKVPSSVLENLQAGLLINVKDAYRWLTVADTKQTALDQSKFLRQDLKSDVQLNTLFAQFALAHGKTYDTAALLTARTNFESNMQMVYKINSDPSLGYWASCNLWCDMDFASFSKAMLMTNPPDQGSIPESVPPEVETGPVNGGRRLLDVWPPTSVDWRSAGKVTPVKNQGSCGSCWAFAATGAIESAYLIAKGTPPCDPMDLSEQQIVSCAPGDCTGGWSTDAIQYVYENWQLAESLYPYTSGGGATGTCDSAKVNQAASGKRVKFSRSYYYSTANSEDNVKRWVATSPTVIYFCVDSAFQLYQGGVYSSNTCGTCHNHAMLLVGYTASGEWIIKNSWGTSSWGYYEGGFARVRMSATANGNKGPCGLHQTVILPPVWEWAETFRTFRLCDWFKDDVLVNFKDWALADIIKALAQSPPPPPNKLPFIDWTTKIPIFVNPGLFGGHRRSDLAAPGTPGAPGTEQAPGAPDMQEAGEAEGAEAGAEGQHVEVKVEKEEEEVAALVMEDVAVIADAV
ncbi:hypothetical protein HYH03_001550 [Edaphochlamys debaryana]|uniref:Peptidase C1A papain C-terminal domain-containing protein n=1 Tax=Edaphochlamys debaryana TaxID=47281 RepID=A0A836C661_9CHLO|nr:hypothetical protein HYH03_001550 [Edaphochlamys debaryana]|eukprot:KAG2500788.1 hypothetical protein HYH03_001550 [Edaphochlamys debaryana]